MEEAQEPTGRSVAGRGLGAAAHVVPPTRAHLRERPRPLPRALATRLDRRTMLRSAAFIGALAGLAPATGDLGLTAGVRVSRGTIDSRHLPGRPLQWRLAVPRGARGLVLALHGKGSGASVWFTALDAQRVARDTGLAIAAIDGRLSYWHPRAGSDAPAMLTTEFLPMLAEHGLPTGRIGLTGVSMGGFGSMYLASELGPERVFGVATVSAALRRSYAATSSGAFDDEADFLRHSIFGRIDRLRRIPVWMACGTQDRFYPGNAALARQLPQSHAVFDDGGHTTAYTRAHWGPALAWLAGRI